MEHSALRRMRPCPDDLGHSVELNQVIELGHTANSSTYTSTKCVLFLFSSLKDIIPYVTQSSGLVSLELSALTLVVIYCCNLVNRQLSQPPSWFIPHFP
jgi:hypothetical protein